MRSGCTGRSYCPSVNSQVVATERLFLKTQDQCKQVYDIITEKLKPEQKTSAIILLMFTIRVAGRSCCPSHTSRVAATNGLFLKTQDQCKRVYGNITEKKYLNKKRQQLFC